MNCGDVRDLVHAYADDELDVMTAREVEEHLELCATCRGKLGEVRAVKGAVGGQYFRAPVGLRERVLQEIGAEEDRSTIRLSPNALMGKMPTGTSAFPGANSARFSGRERGKEGRFFTWRVLATAAVLVIVVGLAFMMRGGGEDRVVAEVLTAHLRSLQPGHLVDVESTDQHTVKPWFDTHVDFSPPVRQLKDEGFPLVGGRLDYFEDRPVAALVYSRGKHLINLFVWPGEKVGGEAQRRGFDVVHWSDGGMTFWAVSDLNREELEKFAQIFRESTPTTTAN